jgi:predicted aspartyl protease
MTVDTGATLSIVRPDVVESLKNLQITGSDLILKTATGEVARVLGEADVRLELGSVEVIHRVVVADIVDDFILGLDVMNKFGFVLDIKNRMLQTGNEEILLHLATASIDEVRVSVSETVRLQKNSEQIVLAELEGDPGGYRTGIIDPDMTKETPIMVARTLVEAGRPIPIRAVNLSDNRVTLQKGLQIGRYYPVLRVVRCEEEPPKPSKGKAKETSVEELFLEGWKHLTDEQIKKARAFIRTESDAFATADEPTGRTNIVQHRINTGNVKPIRQPPRRLSLAKHEEVTQMVDKMKNEGIIEDSSSPWSSSVVLVTKKDGSTRFCVDYRRLNDVTKKDSYPLPRIDDTLSTLAGSRWFSTLDLKIGYWQVGVHPEDKEKTAFSTGSGLYQFNVMPFGLCNAPAIFERLMEFVLRGLTWKTCLVYLDDVMVVGSTFGEHLKNLEEIFGRLRSAHFQLNVKKCNLFQQEVKFLGHVVSPAGIQTDPDKLKAVREWPRPKDKHQLRSFLGLCTYYRRFVKGFADIAKPIHKLTEDKTPFIWDKESESAFRSLKISLCTSPILSIPKIKGQYILDTDASNNGIGAVLSQVQEGEERVIEYYSKVLSKPERNYCVTRKELLVMVNAVGHFHKYLYGQHFKIRTDHAALKWLVNLKYPEGQAARWLERLQQYDFKIEHRAGKSHQNADALSRRPCRSDCKHCSRKEKSEDVGTVNRLVLQPQDGWTTAEVRSEQLKDSDIVQILEAKENGDQRPSWQEVSDKSPAFKALWAQWDSLRVENGLLKRAWESVDGKAVTMQLVLPKCRVKEVLQEIHGGTSGAHFGVNKTLGKIRERFYWVNARDDIETWCRKCATCAASKGPRTRSRGLMKQYNVGAPFERIAFDIAGPFPVTDSGNKYIMVVIDYFSKWPEAYGLPNQEAVTVSRALIENWICRYGLPLEMHSHQGRNFESNVFQGVCELLGVRKTRTTPLHPQSDGMVERFNRTMEQHLSKVVDQHQRDWDRHLPLFLLVYRAVIHETTHQTPAKILFGHELRLPCDLSFGSPARVPKDVSSYVDELQEAMHSIHDLTRSHILVASDRMKTRYDLKANVAGFREGDLVWLFNRQRKKGRCPKLQPSWEGPFVILTRINDVVYRIQRHSRAKMKVVHLDRLAPYAGDNDQN